MCTHSKCWLEIPPTGTNSSQPATLIHVYARDITRVIVDAIAISKSQALSSPIDEEGHLIKGVASNRDVTS